jgi:hypothetical protein
MLAIHHRSKERRALQFLELKRLQADNPHKGRLPNQLNCQALNHVVGKEMKKLTMRNCARNFWSRCGSPRTKRRREQSLGTPCQKKNDIDNPLMSRKVVL